MEGQRWRDHNPVPQGHGKLARHGSGNLRPADHVSICVDGTLGQGDPRDADLPISGTANEVRRGQVRSLPDQRPLLLPERPRLYLRPDQERAGGAVMSKPKVAFFDFETRSFQIALSLDVYCRTFKLAIRLV